MNLRDLPRDPTNHVVSFLSFAETFALRLTSRTVEAKIAPRYKDFGAVVRAHLTGILPDPATFLERLHHFDNYLAGSFVLQCLVGEDWLRTDPSSDIDIFGIHDLDWRDAEAKVDDPDRVFDEYKLRYYTPYEDFLTKNRKGDPNWSWGLQKWLNSEIIQARIGDTYEHDTFNGPNYDDTMNYAINSLCMTRVYRLGGHTVEFVRVYRSHSTAHAPPTIWDQLGDSVTFTDIYSYLRKSADLAITKNVFDGVRLSVYDWDSIWTKSDSIYLRDCNVIPYYHWPDSSVETATETYEARILYRVNKYRTRGFKVDTDVTVAPDQTPGRDPGPAPGPDPGPDSDPDHDPDSDSDQDPDPDPDQDPASDPDQDPDDEPIRRRPATRTKREEQEMKFGWYEKGTKMFYLIVVPPSQHQEA